MGILALHGGEDVNSYSTFVADIASTAPGLAVAYAIASYACGVGGVLASRKLVAAGSTTPIRPPMRGAD